MPGRPASECAQRVEVIVEDCDPSWPVGEELPAARGKLDHRSFAGDQALVRGFFPNRQARAGGPPTLHHLGVRARRPPDPFKQIANQGSKRVGHEASVPQVTQERQYMERFFLIYAKYGSGAQRQWRCP